MKHQQNQNNTIGQLLQQIGGALQQTSGNGYHPKPPKQFFAPGGGRQPMRHAPNNRKLPASWANLRWMCSSGTHFAPVPAAFVRFTHSDKGHPLAHYKCGACGKSYFLGQHATTNKPMVLFTKG